MIKKLCWWCKHFTYYSGSPEYSEYTPGCDIELLCAKIIGSLILYILMK